MGKSEDKRRIGTKAGAIKLSPVLPIVVFFLSFLSVGLFHEVHSAVFSATICIVITVIAVKKKELTILINPTSVSVFVITASYLLVTLWANDKGEALIGFFKYLPALLFLILIMQYDGIKEKLLEFLPHFAAGSVIVTALLMQVPPLKRYFSVAGRLSGLFEYPNTFALFTLIALLIILTKKDIEITGYIECAVLTFGIIYSGSRFTFVLSGISVIAALFINRGKRKTLFAMLSIGLPAIGLITYGLIAGRLDSLTRFLSTSLESSSLLGRVLYWIDALPEILSHPFGHGYMSYYLTQSTFQSGVYSVRYMHNDVLQFAFDIGWIPALVFVSLFLYHFFKKESKHETRLIIAVFFAHLLFDFDIQFTAMFMLLIVFLDTESGKTITLENVFITRILPVTLALMSVYFTSSLAFSLAGNHTASAMIYPANTENNINMMLEADEKDKESIADRIITSNNEVYSAYMVKATASFSKGDFLEVINNGKKALELAPYNYDQYAYLSSMLIYGVSLYEQNGDHNSADYCRQSVVEIENMYQKAKSALHPIAYKISDSFKESLPEDLEAVVAEYKYALSSK